MCAPAPFAGFPSISPSSRLSDSDRPPVRARTAVIFGRDVPECYALARAVVRKCILLLRHMCTMLTFWLCHAMCQIVGSYRTCGGHISWLFGFVF